jgi:hypothetical protein
VHKKHLKTYQDLHAESIKRNIEWRAVTELIEALGEQVLHGESSRVRFDLNGVSLNIHSWHPQRELKRYQVKALREFLTNSGVQL